MKKIWWTGLAAVLSTTVMAQDAETLYLPGRSIEDQQIRVQGWGSGSIAETDEAAYEGVTSIRITSKNYFQGGTIIFDNPIDVSQEYQDKSNLLKFTYLVADGSITYNAKNNNQTGQNAQNRRNQTGGRQIPEELRGAQQGRGALADQLRGLGQGQLPPGVRQPGGAEGGRPGAGLRGGQQPGNQRGNKDDKDQLKTFRFIVTTTDGKKSEVYVDVPLSGASFRGWKTIAVPLQGISGFDRTNKVIKDISISTDALATLFIGDIRVLSDTTPIKGETNAIDLNLAYGDEVILTASGYGGSSILKYTWDFDARDGIQVDAEGPVIRRKFRVPGDYVITVTISDLFGLKEPYVTTIKATVNP